MGNRLKNMMEWLKDLDGDQNLVGLENIENVIQNQAARKWFKRQDLTPGIFTAYYNRLTGKTVLGHPLAWKSNALEEPGVVATSAAKHTWTAPAKCEILAVTRVNNNRAFYVTLSYKRSGGTERNIGLVPNNISGNDPAAGQAFNLMANFQKAMEGPWIVDTDDEIYTTDGAFVAADVCQTVILYRLVN